MCVGGMGCSLAKMEHTETIRGVGSMLPDLWEKNEADQATDYRHPLLRVL